MNTSSRILLVDDEPNVRLMFRTTLTAAGYTVTEASDGMAALGMLQQSTANLILLDLQMPNLNGMATLKSIREQGLQVPVIIITAHGSVPDAVEAMKLGAIDFLSKPVTPEALRAVVSEVLTRHATATPGPLVPASVEVANDPAPATASSQFAGNMAKAKRAINQGQFDEAKVFLTQAAALDPKSAEANNLMGVLHELKGQNDDAYRFYRAALKADKSYTPATHNMTRYYERFTFGSSKVPMDVGD